MSRSTFGIDYPVEVMARAGDAVFSAPAHDVAFAWFLGTIVSGVAVSGDEVAKSGARCKVAAQLWDHPGVSPNE